MLLTRSDGRAIDECRVIVVHSQRAGNMVRPSTRPRLVKLPHE